LEDDETTDGITPGEMTTQGRNNGGRHLPGWAKDEKLEDEGCSQGNSHEVKKKKNIVSMRIPVRSAEVQERKVREGGVLDSFNHSPRDRNSVKDDRLQGG
jgi:hypothetical protein